MKRIIIAFLVFATLTTVGVVGAVYFDTTCKEVSDAVNEAMRHAERGAYGSAAVTVQNAERFWEKRRKILNFYVNHGLLYEVDNRLTGLAELSSEEAKEEFFSTAEQVTEAIRYISSDK